MPFPTTWPLAITLYLIGVCISCLLAHIGCRNPLRPSQFSIAMLIAGLIGLALITVAPIQQIEQQLLVLPKPWQIHQANMLILMFSLGTMVVTVVKSRSHAH